MILRGAKKGAQLREINREGAVIVLGIAENSAVQANKRLWLLGESRFGGRRRRPPGHLRHNHRF
jgi:hypothetical protein